LTLALPENQPRIALLTVMLGKVRLKYFIKPLIGFRLEEVVIRHINQ
jgi:hypothetical protein